MEYTIQNEWLTLTVSTAGAEAVSVKATNGHEFLWQADPGVWPRHAPILFPYTGPLPHSTRSWQGRDYPCGLQHGFARDKQHRLVSKTADTLVFQLCPDEETRAVYPFDFLLQSTFVLRQNTVHHTLRVQNPGSGLLRFGLGFHPGFRCPFDSTKPLTDYELRFDRPQPAAALHNYPTAEKEVGSILLTADTFAKGPFLMQHPAPATVTLAERGTARRVVCHIEGYPYCLLWSPPAAPGHLVCIEPWHSLPDVAQSGAAWETFAPAAQLAPGEEWAATLVTEYWGETK